VRPALEAARADGVRAPRRLAGSTAAAVVSTSLAGWFLTALHRRSGSVTAPLVVHAASNALGTLAVAAADRLAHR
jgi:membrane protease YdiL (CAAX protease family)